MNKIKTKIFMAAIVIITTAPTYAAKPVACADVSKQCTTDVRFDKTIEGAVYSCYECKQTVCKSGGSGPIAGTETSTVCESKAPSYKALIQSQHTTQFDEADAMFGKRTEVKAAESNNGNNSNKSNTGVVYKKPQKVITRDHRRQIIEAPSNVTLYDVTNQGLSISWMDNANNEYGVSIDRGMPIEDRGGINYQWQHVFNVEERIDSNVKGTGWRTDGDDGLASDTEYCYRLRAYNKTDFSEYSSPVCTTTKQ